MFLASHEIWSTRVAMSAAGSLTALERRVVALSLFDHRSSIEPASWLMRFCDRAFGLRPANQLADLRLETLRRYGILLRLSGGAVSEEERERMVVARFSETALDDVARLVAMSSRAPQSERAKQ